MGAYFYMGAYFRMGAYTCTREALANAGEVVLIRIHGVLILYGCLLSLLARRSTISQNLRNF